MPFKSAVCLIKACSAAHCPSSPLSKNHLRKEQGSNLHDLSATGFQDRGGTNYSLPFQVFFLFFEEHFFSFAGSLGFEPKLLGSEPSFLPIRRQPNFTYLRRSAEDIGFEPIQVLPRSDSNRVQYHYANLPYIEQNVSTRAVNPYVIDILVSGILF